MIKASVRRVGNSLGITIPRSVLDSYHIEDGDDLYLVETQDGLMLTPYDPKFSAWAKAYESTNKRYKNTLRELAK
jgi:putative addiction module antidote